MIRHTPIKGNREEPLTVCVGAQKDVLELRLLLVDLLDGAVASVGGISKGAGRSPGSTLAPTLLGLPTAPTLIKVKIRQDVHFSRQVPLDG